MLLIPKFKLNSTVDFNRFFDGKTFDYFEIRSRVHMRSGHLEIIHHLVGLVNRSLITLILVPWFNFVAKESRRINVKFILKSNFVKRWAKVQQLPVIQVLCDVLSSTHSSLVFILLPGISCLIGINPFDLQVLVSKRQTVSVGL